jgi:MFS family permease
MIVSLGLGAVFVGVTTAANAGVPADKAGLAAALLNASQQVGGALGLAVLSALATARAHNLLAAHASQADAFASGFGHALLVGGILLVAAAVIALRTSNTREDSHQRLPDVLPTPVTA